MAQTGFTPILLYASNTATSIPSAGNLTNSANGAEVAVNTADKRLFTKDSGGAVVELGTNPSTFSLPNGTANGVLYLNGSKVATSGSALTFDGTNFRLISAGSLPGTAFGAFAVASAGTPTTAYASVLSTAGTYNGGFESTLYLGSSRTDIVDNGRISGYRLKVVNTSAAADSYLSFESGSSATGAFAPPSTYSEQMRLTSTGLGIGTSSPGYKVGVQSSSDAKISIKTTGVSSSAGLEIAGANATFDTDNVIVWQGGTKEFYLWNRANSYITFGTNNGEKARLDSSGNLGLGVTPSAWLWPNGSAGAMQLQSGGGLSAYNASTYLSNNWYYNGGEKYIANGLATRYEQSSGAHAWYSASNNTSGAGATVSWGNAKMTLDASGYLLVGATSSAGVGISRLQVGSTSAATTQILIQGASTHLGLYAASAAEVYVSYAVGSALIFGNGPANGSTFTERARITSGGDLLVGTTSVPSPFTTPAITAYRSGSSHSLVATGNSAGFDPIISWNRATAGDNAFVAFGTEGTWTSRGTIDYNRAGGLVRYNTTSDYRAKDIIGPVQNPGATIDALKVYEGVMKGATQSRPMLIAHEAQAHAPYAVSGVKDEVNEDGTPKFQQIDVSSLVPLLLAEIQSLRARVAALEAQP